MMINSPNTEDGVVLGWTQDGMVVAQWINALGQQKWTANGYTLQSSGTNRGIEMVPGPNNTAVFTWYTSSAIYAQKLTGLNNATPNVAWSNAVNVTPLNPDSPTHPQVDVDPNGSVVVGWENYRFAGCCAYEDVFAQRLESAYQISLDATSNLNVLNSNDVSVKTAGPGGLTGQDQFVRLTDTLSNDNVIADMTVDVVDDLSWTALRGKTFPGSGVAYVKNIEGLPGINFPFSFYVPKETGANSVILCKTFTEIEDINPNCSNKITKVEADVDVSVVDVNGKAFWKIDNQTESVGGVSYPVNEDTDYYTLSNSDNKLRVVDIKTGMSKSKRDLNYTSTVVRGGGFAKHPDNPDYYGVIYIQGQLNPIFTKIDVANGNVTKISDMVDQFSSLVFAPDGTLYGTVSTLATSKYKLYTINPSTGTETEVATMSGMFLDDGQVIAYNTNDSMLYHLSGSVIRYFEKIDPSSYVITNIGASGLTFNTPLGIQYYADQDVFFFNDLTNKYFQITPAGVVTLKSYVDVPYVGFGYKEPGPAGSPATPVSVSASNNKANQIEVYMSIPVGADITTLSLRRKPGACSAQNFFSDHTDGTGIYSTVNPATGQILTYLDTNVTAGQDYCYAAFTENILGWNDEIVYDSTNNYASGTAVEEPSTPTDPETPDDNGDNDNDTGNNDGTNEPIYYGENPVDGEELETDDNQDTDDTDNDENQNEQLNENTEEPKEDEDINELPVTADNKEKGRVSSSAVATLLTVIGIVALVTSIFTSKSGNVVFQNFVFVITNPRAIPYLVWKRNRKPWGIIYDNRTSEPIPFVTVRAFTDHGKFVKDALSDMEGRYALAVPSGSYVIEFLHQDYQGIKKTIDISSDRRSVLLDISLNVKENLNLFSTIARSIRNLQIKETIIQINKMIFIIGLISSLFLTVFHPTSFNVLVLAFYVLGTMLYYYKTITQGNSVVEVKDKSNRPITGAIVRFFSPKLEVVDVQMTPMDGLVNYSLVSDQAAYIQVVKPGYSVINKHVSKNKNITDLITITGSERDNSLNVVLSGGGARGFLS